MKLMQKDFLESQIHQKKIVAVCSKESMLKTNYTLFKDEMQRRTIIIVTIGEKIAQKVLELLAVLVNIHNYHQ